ncbi:uncharacterized protein LOC135681983 isoform X2 [Rhopilema esculentum]|uniref:uncharacterized protein LOC135681983 isoform X2 n=1 Tax=Rhopilema esculentum TaxID=499914 RepID=UPI0031E3944A
MACLVEENAFTSLVCNTESANGKFLSFTKVEKGTLVISATDGIRLWQIELCDDDLKSYSSAAGLDSEEKYLDIIKESFQKSDVNISVLPQRMVLYFGSKPGSISLDLFEAACEQKKFGLQELLFKLADNIKTLERQLSEASQKLKQVEDANKMESPQSSPFKDSGTKRLKTVPKPRQLKGSSVINPGSKRKKAAQGVLFE